VIASESPVLKAPLPLVVKLTVQFAVEPAVCGAPLKPSEATFVALAIEGATVAAAVSTLVVNVNVAAPIVTVFVGVSILKESAVPAAIEQLAPASVIVTTWPLPTADPTVHVPKPLVSAIAGDEGTVKPPGNVTLMKSPAFSAPLVFGGPATVALVVRPIVQVERAPAVCGEPDAPRPVTGVAAAIVTLPAGAVAAVSPDVLTDQLVTTP
jgi:hypothetical protein